MRQQLKDSIQCKVFVIDGNDLYATPIPGFASYAATTAGEIINIQRNHTLKPYRSGKGYLKVNLSGNQIYVHRLITLTFLEDTASLDRDGNERVQVNHINGDKTDNRLCSLELTSSKESHHWNKVIKEAGAERFKQLIGMCESFVFVERVRQI